MKFLQLHIITDNRWKYCRIDDYECRETLKKTEHSMQGYPPHYFTRIYFPPFSAWLMEHDNVLQNEEKNNQETDTDSDVEDIDKNKEQLQCSKKPFCRKIKSFTCADICQMLSCSISH